MGRFCPSKGKESFLMEQQAIQSALQAQDIKIPEIIKWEENKWYSECNNTSTVKMHKS